MIEIKVKEKTTVYLRYCSQEALDSFGSIESPKVDGDLVLWQHTGIKKLPDDLRVAGYLSIRNCTGLTELPDDLKVNGGMSLIGCSGITKLPEGIHVEGEILYNSKTGFCGHEDEPGVIPDRLKHKLEEL
jgi:hypothetical protein